MGPFKFKYGSPPEANLKESCHHVLYLLNEGDDITARCEIQGQLSDFKSWWGGVDRVPSNI